MKRLLLIGIFTLFGTSAIAGDFKISFNWNDLRLCTSGRPNIVGNPVFTLSDVPDGTKWLYFGLTDLDARTYRHGGGWVEYNGNVTDAGVFKYKSPCPPNGTHTYEWQVTATKNQNLDGALGVAISRQTYP